MMIIDGGKAGTLKNDLSEEFVVTLNLKLCKIIVKY